VSGLGSRRGDGVGHVPRRGGGGEGGLKKTEGPDKGRAKEGSPKNEPDTKGKDQAMRNSPQ